MSAAETVSEAHSMLCRAAGRLALMIAKRRLLRSELLACCNEAGEAIDKLKSLIGPSARGG